MEVFSELLIENGWQEIQKEVMYKKGTWEIIYDTSSWMILSTDSNPRIFDVPVPWKSHLKWTMNLIEYLFIVSDSLHKLKIKPN